MNEHAHTHLMPAPVLSGAEPETRDSEVLAEQIKDRWREGDSPDLTDIIRQNPNIKWRKSTLLGLAYEEYRLRVAHGEVIDRRKFCGRFRSMRKSLFRMLEVHQYFEEHSDLFPEEEEGTLPGVGDIVLGFLLVEHLGRGAFADVFLAREEAIGQRLVVVKLSHDEGHEAQTLGQLEHPSIVPILSVQTNHDVETTAICMPYVGRATLCDVLDQAFEGPKKRRPASTILAAIESAGSPQNPLKANQSINPIFRNGSYVEGVVCIAAQLADALTHTHAKGILHQDLKPSNVLLTPTGRPMLLDFNLSIDDKVVRKSDGGTLPYMSPEQIQATALGRSEPCDERSDLFSLGVLIYELLSGKLPFEPAQHTRPLDEVATNLLEQQRSGPPSLRQSVPELDKQLDRIVAKCLMFKPSDRPQSAEEVAKGLQACLTARRRVHRWLLNHWIMTCIALVVLGGMSVGAVAFLVSRPSLDVREYRQGTRYLEQGDYELAVNHLTESIDANSASAEAFMARGQSYLQLEQYELAETDFDLASQLNPTGEAFAGRAYSLTKLQYYREAIELYRNAIAAGFATAAVHNDLAYAYLAQPKFDAAERELDAAIKKSSTLQAAFHNRAVVHLKLATLRKDGSALKGIKDIEKAIVLGPAKGEHYYHAALLCAVAAATDAKWNEAVPQYLSLAFANGLDVNVARSNPLLSHLHGSLDTNEVKTTQESHRAFMAERVVNPLQ